MCTRKRDSPISDSERDLKKRCEIATMTRRAEDNNVAGNRRGRTVRSGSFFIVARETAKLLYKISRISMRDSHQARRKDRQRERKGGRFALQLT